MDIIEYDINDNEGSRTLGCIHTLRNLHRHDKIRQQQQDERDERTAREESRWSSRFVNVLLVGGGRIGPGAEVSFIYDTDNIEDEKVKTFVLHALNEKNYEANGHWVNVQHGRMSCGTDNAYDVKNALGEAKPPFAVNTVISYAIE